MTTLLKKAIKELTSLPQEKQDFYAQEILDAIKDEEKWDTLFNDPKSTSVLSQMAAQARKEYQEGQTQSLDELIDTRDE